MIGKTYKSGATGIKRERNRPPKIFKNWRASRPRKNDSKRRGRATKTSKKMGRSEVPVAMREESTWMRRSMKPGTCATCDEEISRRPCKNRRVATLDTIYL